MVSAREFMTRKATGKFISWDDKEIGDSVGGVILSEPTMQQQTDASSGQPRFFPVDDNGNREPMMQMLIEIDTFDPDPALATDDGKRILAVRGGFKYESSKKALMDALGENDLDFVRIGDYVELTRLPNVKGAGTKGRTHQFSCLYSKVENWDAELDAETLARIRGTATDEAQATPAAPARRGRPKKVAAPAAPAKAAPVKAESAWEDDE